eukprot:TRINITY_DN2875_c0_g3_i2.p1 TRINITY_DN2875_c0_g3~~TRINITY_DN2875_c0_g3_i2.p1  ORF type:complete len:1314 (+),score=367.78 TRINITY_DN2875_c0_g3_i2:81-3944(+)
MAEEGGFEMELWSDTAYIAGDTSGGGGGSVFWTGGSCGSCADDVKRPSDPRPEHTYAGLQNQGGTCYLNALLQAVFATRELRRPLLAVDPQSVELEAKRKFLVSFQRFFAELALLDVSAVETKDLTDAFGWERDQVVEQQDASELNRVLIDSLSRACEESPIAHLADRVYGFTLSTGIHCGTCSGESAHKECMMDLPAPLSAGTLESCMSSYFLPEPMVGENRYFCERCDARVDAERRMRLESLPPVLTVNLGRFTYDKQTWQRVKLNQKVSFPLRLDVGKHADVCGQDARYALFGVIVHSGGAYSGHYYAYLRPVDVGPPAQSTEAEDAKPAATDPESASDEAGAKHADPEAAPAAASAEDSEASAKHADPETGEAATADAKGAEAGAAAKGSEAESGMAALTDGCGEDDVVRHGWFCFNDSSVRPATLEDIVDSFSGSACAYMLMYRRVEAPKDTVAVAADGDAFCCASCTADDVLTPLRAEMAERSAQLRADRATHAALEGLGDITLHKVVDKDPQPHEATLVAPVLGSGAAADGCGLPHFVRVEPEPAPVDEPEPSDDTPGPDPTAPKKIRVPLDIGYAALLAKLEEELGCKDPQVWTISSGSEDLSGAPGTIQPVYSELTEAEDKETGCGMRHKTHLLVAHSGDVPSGGLAEGSASAVTVRVDVPGAEQETQLLLPFKGLSRSTLAGAMESLSGTSAADLCMLTVDQLERGGDTNLLESKEGGEEAEASDHVSVSPLAQLVLTTKERRRQMLEAAPTPVSIVWHSSSGGSIPLEVFPSGAVSLSSDRGLLHLSEIVEEAARDGGDRVSSGCVRLWTDERTVQEGQPISTADDLVSALADPGRNRTLHAGVPGRGDVPFGVFWRVAATDAFDERGPFPICVHWEDTPQQLLEKLCEIAAIGECSDAALHFCAPQGKILRRLRGKSLRESGLRDDEHVAVVRDGRADTDVRRAAAAGALPIWFTFALPRSCLDPDSGAGSTFAEVGRIACIHSQMQSLFALRQSFAETIEAAAAGKAGTFLDLVLPGAMPVLQKWCARPARERHVWMLAKQGPQLLRQSKGCVKQGLTKDRTIALAVAPELHFPLPRGAPTTHSQNCVVHLRVREAVWSDGEDPKWGDLGPQLTAEWLCGLHPSSRELQELVMNMVQGSEAASTDGAQTTLVKVQWMGKRVVPVPDPVDDQQPALSSLRRPPFLLSDLVVLRMLVLRTAPESEPPPPHAGSRLAQADWLLTPEEAQDRAAWIAADKEDPKAQNVRFADHSGGGGGGQRRSQGRPERGVVINTGF